MKTWGIGFIVFCLVPEIQCAYSNYTLVRTQITNFTDLYVNNFGFPQGLRLNNSDMIYRRHDDPTYSYAELAAGNQSFFSNFYNESDGIPFDGQDVDLLQIEIVPPKEWSFDFDLRLWMAKDHDCSDYELGQMFYVPNWTFLKTYRGTLMAYQAISPIMRRRLCFLEINRLNKVSKFVSISFTKIIFNSTPDILPTDDRFVWKRDLELIHLNRPFRFASFYAPTFLSASELEQEDLIRTVATFSKGSYTVFKIGSPVNCNNINTNNVDFNNMDCALVERKPRIYKESVFHRLDRGISLASRFGTFMIVPLNSIMFEINPFSLSRLNMESESFYNDRTIIEDFKFYINYVLNRRNNITGILYKDDPTILGWSLGERWTRPPTVWVAEISEFIKSIDKNHLLIIEYSDASESLLVPQIDIVLTDHSFNIDANNCPQYAYNAQLFQKIFILENQYDYKDFTSFIQSCFANSTFAGGRPLISGVLANFLGGRTEKSGLFQVKGMRYPGLGDVKERAAFQLISNISAMFREEAAILYKPLDYAPRMLWVSYLSASSFKFSWFGVVEAILYELHRSFDDGPFEIRASNISELSSAPEYLESDLPKPGDCDIIVNFRFYGVNEDRSIRSPPMIFNVTIKSASNVTSLKCKNIVPSVSGTDLQTEEEKSIGLILIISVVAVSSVCTISAIVLYFYTKRRMLRNMTKKSTAKIQKEPTSLPAKEFGSNQNLITMNPIRDSSSKGMEISQEHTPEARRSFTPKLNYNASSKVNHFRVDNSGRSKSINTSSKVIASRMDESGRSQIAVHFDSDNTASVTASVTMNLSTVNENYTLFVPGYMKLSKTEDFEELEFIGKGATGAVSKANVLNPSFIQRNGVSVVALKAMSSVQNDTFLFEVAIHRLVSDHSNIVRFFGYFQEPNGMVLEICDAPLSNVIYQEKSATESIFSKIGVLTSAVWDIASGCAHIHRSGIVHYDLKTANILMKSTGTGIICKIADFGIAKLVNTDGSTSRTVAGLQTPKNYGYTLRYCAPEIFDILMITKTIRCTPEHFKCDVYSFSIILYELFSGIRAWSDEGGFDVKYVQLDKRPKILDRYRRFQKEPTGISEWREIISGLAEIMQSCWSPSPDERPDFITILERLKQSKGFQEYDYESFEQDTAKSIEFASMSVPSK